jgi:hypothetical protein
MVPEGGGCGITGKDGTVKDGRKRKFKFFMRS